MNEPDYSGVEPLRLPEARRRVQVITDYLNLPSPTVADADRHAEMLGLSRWQLYRLAKVWREHRDPSLLVIGRRGEAARGYGLSERAIEIARGEIVNFGAAAELNEVAMAVETRCAAEDVTPPSRPTLWSYIRKARAEGAATAGPPRIVVGRFWFHLPMHDAALDTMPVLLAAVLLPERIIAAHAVSTDPESPPSVDDVVSRVLHLRKPGADPRPLLLEAADRRAAASALDAADLAGIQSHPLSVQRALARAFGDRLGPLRVIYRRGAAKPGRKRVITRLDQPLAANEAAAIIGEAVDANNALSFLPMPQFDIAQG